MKNLLFLCLVVFGFFGTSAQERYIKPVDEAAKDASFLAFRTKLIAAAKKHDAKYILSIVDPKIQSTFGDDDGLRYFKRVWKIESPKSDFWTEFLPVITNGGTFSKENGNKIFSAPYTFNGFPDDLDSFAYSAIFGNNVNLRAKPEMNATIVGKLSYNIVEITETIKDKNNAEKDAWYEIKTLGGKRGYVKAEFVRSPIDYRAGFEKKNGQWKMIYFIAGD